MGLNYFFYDSFVKKAIQKNISIALTNTCIKKDVFICVNKRLNICVQICEQVCSIVSGLLFSFPKKIA